MKTSGAPFGRMSQHLAVDAVLPEFLGVSLACLFVFDIPVRWFIRRDDRTLLAEIRLGKQFVVLARLIDAGRNEDGVTVTALQSIAGLHVHQDIGNDLLQPVLAAQGRVLSRPD